ncbi:short chain dehydrogenase [Winogradskyella endarachnes]|uniref:Short chain dehydrogenase n=1 Tax=Winogradskyella endarachnes TaxID=2681965 RepID=A0A6L6U8Z4_9FLAO|nr:short chain dehydrogenase [Winogradskyella endarachnes]MUU78648.1 short chain dehydrogenase [Winogradskyella endarachnes]
MKIIVVGASGTMGTHLVKAWKDKHELIKVGSNSGDIIADITSPESIKSMYEKVGRFDALVSTAGPTYVGPWSTLTDDTFRKGLEGKLMGQINLVLIGKDYVKPKSSFTLIAGGLTYEPQQNFANASVANGGIEAFVRAAAIEFEKDVRINAVSPTVIENSPQYFKYFPGEIPVTMKQLEYGFDKCVFGANTGQVVKLY